ncbi:MAG: NBR1-Ig-like domain-containing protein [Anaerolineaceae bacterium]|jgi:hypothetical protein
MEHKKRTLRVIGVLLSLLWLAACSPTVPTSTPTLDLNPIRTEVAATVMAQVTRALALTPSATPLSSPTATNLPTSTPSLTVSPAPSAVVTLSSGTPKAGTVNQAQWVAQSIADDTIFAPGEVFTMTWTLKNTGTSTWTAGYLLRYYSGNTFGAPKEISLGRVVLPGGEIDINITMKAPANPGSYRTDWVMSNENRANFKEPVYLKIKVVAPVTPTPTPKL